MSCSIASMSLPSCATGALTGARGVWRWFELEEGALFEVNAPLSWTSADRYFCRSERGRVVRMTREEIDSAIAARTMVEIATVTL